MYIFKQCQMTCKTHTLDRNFGKRQIGTETIRELNYTFTATAWRNAVQRKKCMQFFSGVEQNGSGNCANSVNLIS